MKTIPIGNSDKYAIVDDADYEMLMSHSVSWSAGSTIICRSKITHQTETMGRLILGLGRDHYQQCDHIDHDIYNNLRSNLRVCSPSENQRNKKIYPNKVSMFRGVVYDKGRVKCWKVKLSFKKDNHQIHLNLGRFDNQIDAAITYNIAAYKHYGEYACLNPVPFVAEN